MCVQIAHGKSEKSLPHTNYISFSVQLAVEAVVTSAFYRTIDLWFVVFVCDFVNDLWFPVHGVCFFSFARSAMKSKA